MKFQLYIATSLDGFIADKYGSIQWLEQIPNPTQSDYGYAEFLAGISTVVMGRATYEQVLSFGVDWPYAEKETFVVTSNPKYPIATPNTYILNEVSADSIAFLKQKTTQNCWIVGGQQINQAFLIHHALNELILTITPVALGSGIPLFGAGTPLTQFQLVNTKTYDSGVVTLTYTWVHPKNN